MPDNGANDTTLEEWVLTLPDGHLARRQFAKLLTDKIMLLEALEQVTDPSLMYADKVGRARDVLGKVAAQVLVLLLLVVPAAAQAPPGCELPPTPVSNPTGACFQVSAIDHAVTDSYALDIYTEAGALLNTIDMGKPDTIDTPNGEQWIKWSQLNVLPVPFGSYFSRARAVAGGVSGPSSMDSNVWERAPAAPGDLRLVASNLSLEMQGRLAPTWWVDRLG